MADFVGEPPLPSRYSRFTSSQLLEGSARKASFSAVLTLAYQSLGVIYGDLSTSPLYVYNLAFSGKLRLHEDDEQMLGVLSFILWTLTLIPLIKYVLIVLNTDDNGEGGTFALYSLLCRHANISLLPSQQEADEEVSTYKLAKSSSFQRPVMKTFIEKHRCLRVVLLMVVLWATCMVICDGVLTPAISVLSAVSGIKVAVEELENHIVLGLACLILVGLFVLQKFGTHKVAFLFAPIVLAWLISISSIGVYNVIHWNPSVFKALSPYYMYRFFQKTGFEGLRELGGIFLCITGCEAMFADLGHFSQLSIKIAFMVVVYPCLMLAYMGQAAFLSKNHDDIQRSFYKSIPHCVYWPVVVIATLASAVGSQAVISAVFSIINQCAALRCFPTVKVVHTSKNIHGQIYIPEINWMLMLLCLATMIGFRDTNLIGNAYGLAVAMVMLITTLLMSLVMLVVWQSSITSAMCFLLFFGSIEGLYLSAFFTKLHMGGWFTLTLALIFMATMYIWHYGTSKKYIFDLENKVSMKRILSLGPSLGIVRVPGIGLIYSELVSGVPAVFSHFVTNLPAFHEILVFVCIKSMLVPFVPSTERFLIGRIAPKEYHMFRCIVRYGYNDVQCDNHHDFENQLVLSLVEYIQWEGKEEYYNHKLLDTTCIDSPSSNDSISREFIVVGEQCQEIAQEQLKKGNNNTPNSMIYKEDKEEGEEMDNVVVESSNKLDTMGEKLHKISMEGMEIGTPILRRTTSLEMQKRKLPLGVIKELKELESANEAGIVYFLGHPYVKAKRMSSSLNRFVINVVYSFLRKNFRRPSIALKIPHNSLIEVGIICYI